MANPEHLEILKRGVEAWNRWRRKSPVLVPDLSGADLSGADLREANFLVTRLAYAKLTGTNLYHADFVWADLQSADLRHADFTWAHLSRANLDGADLSGARLAIVEIVEASLKGTNFAGAQLGWAKFGNVNLSKAVGLDSIKHIGPSTVGIDTVYRSAGRIPEAFLRGCGAPESFIMQLPALVRAAVPIQFYSCFISYSSTDQEFAERLHADLQNKGVRVWFAPHDMKIGARIRPTIDESIRVYDKLLLVLSEHSVSSQWVEQEVETALSREREQEGKTVLFPIRVDDAIMEVKAGWPALLKNTRNVGDFTRWKDHDSYQKAFDRLLRDLKAEA